jgi:hypothetical protein
LGNDFSLTQGYPDFIEAISKTCASRSGLPLWFISKQKKGRVLRTKENLRLARRRQRKVDRRRGAWCSYGVKVGKGGRVESTRLI